VMKKLKIWMAVFGAVVLAGGASTLLAAHPRARAQAQEAPAFTQAELLTVTLLQSILGELVKLNDNIEQQP
jgi:hypothetical protein